MSEEVIKEAWKEEISIDKISVQNGDYTNVYLTPYNGSPGLQPGEWFAVQKNPQFAELKKTKEGKASWGDTWKRYNGSVFVGEKEYHIALFNDDATTFNNLGGVGDTVLISKEKLLYKDKKGVERAKERLVFKLAPEEQ